MVRLAPAGFAVVIALLAWLAGTPASGEEPGDPLCLLQHGAEHAGGPGHEHSGEPSAPAWDGLEDFDLTEAFTFHPERGETAALRYRLAKPALVQIRVKEKATRDLFLATILNWERREPGEHVESWNGRSDAGDLVDMSRATIGLVARDPEHGHGTMPLEERSPEEIVHADEEHLHGTHHSWAEEVPALRILEPAPNAEVGDLLLIRSVVDQQRRGYGDQYGYGVRYYVDGELVREEFYQPESDGQFAYRLDTTAFADGEHLLQVGMCDHHQHATSRSVPVSFRNASRNP